jgi:UDP:flavonoid glycosyltransferase YjiC (YdhE family)
VTAAPVALVFSMGEPGHFHRLVPLVAGMAAAGVRPYVFTARSWTETIRRAGGELVDLFAHHTLDDADRSSVPLPCRTVTFAGRFGDAIAEVAAPLKPAFVVHDAFALIGQVVAQELGIPRISVCAGHNLPPRDTREALRHDPRVRISEACWKAVERLRSRFDIPGATPFSYYSDPSPVLNIYCEPPQFLKPGERGPFEPIAFFGSLSPDHDRIGLEPDRRADSRTLVYASFGTIVWRYYEDVAIAALEALCAGLRNRDDVRLLISLGRSGSMARVAHLASPQVEIEEYVDQWQVLRTAAACVTHHGLNSTHEAIYQQVPMISYPFFGDQPGLSARCAELGLAVPLVRAVRGTVEAADVTAALARLDASRSAISGRLAEAREWELAVIRERPRVVQRMLALVL